MPCRATAAISSTCNDKEGDGTNIAVSCSSGFGDKAGRSGAACTTPTAPCVTDDAACCVGELCVAYAVCLAFASFAGMRRFAVVALSGWLCGAFAALLQQHSHARMHALAVCQPVANQHPSSPGLTCSSSTDSQVTQCDEGFTLCESGSGTTCSDGSAADTWADKCTAAGQAD